MNSTKHFGCVNNTIRLRSGLYLDLADPKPECFTFADIAGALSKICRFGGQIERFYSVAEHCCHCADLADREGCDRLTQVAALMHDAAEAFIGDMVKPLKIMMPGYAEVERRMEAAIAAKFRIDFEREAFHVTRVDREMLIAERRQLFSRDNVEWTGEREVEEVDVEILCLEPEEAERRFTELAVELGVAVQ